MSPSLIVLAAAADSTGGAPDCARYRLCQAGHGWSGEDRPAGRAGRGLRVRLQDRFVAADVLPLLSGAGGR